MKRFLIVILSLSLNLLCAQEYKIIYEFKWASDTPGKSQHSELTALVIDNGHSYFSSLDKARQDSATTKVVSDFLKKGDGQLRIPSLDNDSKFNSVISKDLIAQHFTVEENIYDKVYITKYNCKLNWKISSEKAEIFGYPVQKAETGFGGRKWIAWFTNSIPINDGPYKFSGLPGLILKISDLDNNFTFEIKGLTKEGINLSQRNFVYSAVDLKPEQWNIFWQKYKKEPSMIFANLNNEHTTYVIDGKNVEDAGLKESYNKKEWERISYFKIPLEIKDCKE